MQLLDELSSELKTNFRYFQFAIEGVSLQLSVYFGMSSVHLIMSSFDFAIQFNKLTSCYYNTSTRDSGCPLGWVRFTSGWVWLISGWISTLLSTDENATRRMSSLSFWKIRKIRIFFFVSHNETIGWYIHFLQRFPIDFLHSGYL